MKNPIYYGTKNRPFKVRLIKNKEQLFNLSSNYISMYMVLKEMDNKFPFYLILEHTKVDSGCYIKGYTYKWVAKNFYGFTKNEVLFKYIIQDKYKLVEILNLPHINLIINTHLIEDNVEVIINEEELVTYKFSLTYLVDIWKNLKIK